MDHFAHGEDLRCPKCPNGMLYRRIRTVCMTEGCKRWTIVEGDPTFNNWNFYHKASEQHIDIRNQGFVCDVHKI